jgi:O-antigen/teichoic acid export membrane protein
MAIGDGMEDIKGTALRGGLAKLFGQAGTFAVRLAFMAIVARLLAPEDFGLVAMVTVITAVLELFASAGLSAASVQRPTINDHQISTLFWVNILVGVMLSLLCLMIAPFVVAFYHEPRLFWVTVAMGAGFFFNAAGVQHLALMQRQLRYTALAAIEFLSQLASLSIGVIMAVEGWGYWSLVAAAVAAPAILTAGLWAFTAWIPGRPRRNTDLFSLLHFGGTVTISGVVAYIAHNFDRFIIGRVWGATAVGQYSVASQLVNTPTANINMAIGGVLFAVLSRLQHDEERFKNYLLKAYSLIVSMTLPTTIFAAAFAGDIIPVVLGPKWLEATEVFRLLVPSVLVFGLINPLGWYLWSSGRHVRCFRLSLALLALVISACLVGLAYGPVGVAISFSTAMVLWLVPHVVWSLHGTNIRPLELLAASTRPLISALVAVALTYAVHRALGLSSPFLNLLAEGVVMGIVYPLMLLFVMNEKHLYVDLLQSLGFGRTGLSPRAPIKGVPSQT